MSEEVQRKEEAQGRQHAVPVPASRWTPCWEQECQWDLQKRRQEKYMPVYKTGAEDPRY